MSRDHHIPLPWKSGQGVVLRDPLPAKLIISHLLMGLLLSSLVAKPRAGRHNEVKTGDSKGNALPRLWDGAHSTLILSPVSKSNNLIPGSMKLFGRRRTWILCGGAV